MKTMLHKNPRIRIRSNTKNSCPFVFCFVLFSVFFALLPSISQAAELKLSSPIHELSVNQQFQVDLVLDTEKEEINAVEGKVIFPENLLELKEIRDGNSIINFWIERPKVKSGNQIAFSGIIPGGYTGKKGLIFSAIFQSKNKGESTIEIQEAKTLLNDGKGTQALLSISNLQFLISEQVPSPQIPISEIIDNEPPESFVPKIAADPSIFDGKMFLVFATQDKKSGIDYFEVRETRQRILTMFSKWIPAESPYVLQDQDLRSYVFVKAVDRAGNERIVFLPPKYPLKWYEQPLVWVILILGVIIGYVLWRRLKNLESRK